MKKLVLIGHPLGHSLSPVMHNAALRELGLDDQYRYELRPVYEHELENIVASIQNEELAGANVTIPYKSKIMRHLSDISEDARAIGSVNTLVRIDKEVRGYNTDVSGFIHSMADHSISLRGKRAIILGAGGAARAIAYALVKEGVTQLDLVNRTLHNSQKLVDDLSLKEYCDVNLWSMHSINLTSDNSDLLINCTPIGMTGHSISKTPVKADFLHRDMIVTDLVYNPRMTKLLQMAEREGCTIIDGIGMLVHQGAQALELWTNEKPPIETMKRSVIDVLGGK